METSWPWNQNTRSWGWKSKVFVFVPSLFVQSFVCSVHCRTDRTSLPYKFLVTDKFPFECTFYLCLHNCQQDEFVSLFCYINVCLHMFESWDQSSEWYVFCDGPDQSIDEIGIEVSLVSSLSQFVEIIDLKILMCTYIWRPRSIDKRWILEEIFVSTVNYIKWNFVSRISVSLLDGLMRFIDPVVTLLLPRGATNFTAILLTAIYKKLQFAIMYWFNTLFFYM